MTATEMKLHQGSVGRRDDGDDLDHWPDEHVAWQGVIGPDVEMSVPFVAASTSGAPVRTGGPPKPDPRLVVG